MQEEGSLAHRPLGWAPFVVYAPLAPPGGGGCAPRSLGRSLSGNAKVGAHLSRLCGCGGWARAAATATVSSPVMSCL